MVMKTEAEIRERVHQLYKEKSKINIQNLFEYYLKIKIAIKTLEWVLGDDAKKQG